MPENDQQILDEVNASASPIFLDTSLWRQLQDADSMKSFVAAWLDLQRSQLEHVVRAMVVIEDTERCIPSLVTYWPKLDSDDAFDLKAISDLSISEKRIVVRESKIKEHPTAKKGEICHIAVPFLMDERAYGAVTIELVDCSEYHLRWIMRQLQWGAAWIEGFCRRTKSRNISLNNSQLALVLQLLANCVEDERFQAAATHVVTELSSLLGCESVCLGFVKGGHIKIHAISNSAQFNSKSNIVTKISAAMDEAMDQESTLIYPALKSTDKTVLAHSKLAEDCKGSLCTVPLTKHGKIFGALHLQRSNKNAFDPVTVELCEIIATLLGPVLELKHKDEQWLIIKFYNSIKSWFLNLFGSGYLVQKISAVLVLTLVVFFAVVDGDYRVTADASLEGVIQHAIAAPIDGYIHEAVVRAGDVVVEGQVLAKLDDRDLLLERINWVGKQNQYTEQYRDALAQSKPAEVQVLRAKLGQSGAEISLLDEMIKRTHLVAPFDGVVVSGDLSQKMGSPVSKGDVLFEIAPLSLYRVILEVDERDVRHVAAKQEGRLVLTGKSDDALGFQINKITPVAEQKEGRNFFRVEALLDDTPSYLRPGMKGVGKVEIGRRKLIWIWTHNLIDWIRLWLWNWWP